MTLASWWWFSYIRRITLALLVMLVLKDLMLLSGRSAMSRIDLAILMMLFILVL